MKIILISVVVILAMVFSLGFFLPNRRFVTRKAIIKAIPEKVFTKVSDISNQNWRSQIGEIEILNSTPGQEVWIEKPKKGPSIKFRTKAKRSPILFEIEIIDNPQFEGHWVGHFSPTTNGQTEVEFSEQIVMNKFIPKLLSYAFFNIEDSVDTYIKDLKTALE